MVRPIRFLVLLAAVGTLSALFMAVVPDKGLRVGPWTVAFPTWEAFLEQGGRHQHVDLEAAFETYGTKKRLDDSLALELMMRNRLFHFPDDDPSVLRPFFRKLAFFSKEKRLRILHFGDSQIEGHRISHELNRGMQRRYGGGGPGWVAPVSAVQSIAVRQERSGNWTRHAVFGFPRSTTHKRFGLLGAYARFSPERIPLPDSLAAAGVQAPAASTVQEAWFSVAPHGRAPGGWDRVCLAMGHFSDSLHYRLLMGEEELDAGVFPPSEELLQRTWNLGEASGPLRFEWKGTDSPDFYGMSLERATGVYVDNIAMRGSSGTEFHKMDLDLLRRQLGGDEVPMIILQFGGNTLPGIRSQEQLTRYGKYLTAQIRLLKRFFPEAAFLVIGPSDMSMKDGLDYVTFPFLPGLRDTMKETALCEGAMYFDLYEAMGGWNSMPSWVNADPPLASTDHIHFSHQGAKQVADWLLQAFEAAERLVRSEVQ